MRAANGLLLLLLLLIIFLILIFILLFLLLASLLDPLIDKLDRALAANPHICVPPGISCCGRIVIAGVDRPVFVSHVSVGEVSYQSVTRRRSRPSTCPVVANV